jgi:hypothetical protein
MKKSALFLFCIMAAAGAQAAMKYNPLLRQKLDNTGTGSGSGTPGGSSGNVQINCAGSFCGDSGLIFSTTTNSIVIEGTGTFNGSLYSFAPSSNTPKVTIGQLTTTKAANLHMERLSYAPSGTEYGMFIEADSSPTANGTAITRGAYIQTNLLGTKNRSSSTGLTVELSNYGTGSADSQQALSVQNIIWDHASLLNATGFSFGQSNASGKTISTMLGGSVSVTQTGTGTVSNMGGLNIAMSRSAGTVSAGKALYVHLDGLSNVYGIYSDGAINYIAGNLAGPTAVTSSGTALTLGNASDVDVFKLYADSATIDASQVVTLAQSQDAGTINTSTNPLDWSKMKNVPAGFADGTDNTAAGGGDNLGTHIATRTLAMGGFRIVNAPVITSSSTVIRFGVASDTDVLRVYSTSATINGVQITTGVAGVAIQPFDADLADLADGSLTGSKVGIGVPAANIASGSLGAGVIASSIAYSGFFNSAAVRSNLGLAIGSNVQAYDADLDDLADGSLTGSKVGSGVPAANIASGSLGSSVLVSSVAQAAVYPRALKAIDSPADNEVYSFDSATGQGEWVAAVGGSGDITDVFNCNSGDCASIVMADGDLLNASSVNNSATTEGIILPQGTAPTGATAEGQIGWDTDDDILIMGTGSGTARINVNSIGQFCTTGFTASHFHMYSQGDVATGRCSASETTAKSTNITFPYNITISSLTFTMTTAPGAGNSWAVTVRENGVDTTITDTISGAVDVEAKDTTHSVLIEAGNVITIGITETGTATNTGNESWNLMYRVSN